MNFIQIILRGVGQVMFQNNIYSGILFLIGIFYNSWLLGLAAVLGTIGSTISAQIFNYPKEDIKNGLYGFNGTLTGIAVLTFFELSIFSISMLILGAILSTYLMKFMKNIIPPFTAPFVIVTWAVIYSLTLLFNFPILSAESLTENSINVFASLSNSFGQVMFQENIVTGLFFLLGILINNRIMALYSVYATVLASLTGWLLSEQTTTINAGLMGYNAILCAIALSGKSMKDFIWISIAVILSTLLNIGLAMTNIITLTAPFVLATWIVLKFKK